MQLDYPVRYLAYHLKSIQGMGLAAIRNGNPVTRPSKLPPLPVHRDETLSPLSNSLVDSYVHWSGADAQRYQHHIPPHFCSHFVMPMLVRLGSLAPYNLLAALNQGLRMEMHKPLPRGERLHLSGSLMDVTTDADRVRIHTRVQVMNAQRDLAMVIDSYSAVPQGKSGKKAGSTKPRSEEAFTTVGTWTAQFHDGLNFAMLTGDFNFIHTVPLVGRLSRFKTLILHGFGQLARTFECIQSAGYDIAALDVRWIKPLTLPNADLAVQVGEKADADGWRSLRLMAQDGSLHMVGRFKGVAA